MYRAFFVYRGAAWQSWQPFRSEASGGMGVGKECLAIESAEFQFSLTVEELPWLFYLVRQFWFCFAETSMIKF